MLRKAEEELGLGPVSLSRAMGISYDTYKDWRSGRRNMSPVAVRCLELLLMYPRTALKLSTVLKRQGENDGG